MSRSNTLFVLGLACGAALGFLASGSFPGRDSGTKPANIAAHDHEKTQAVAVNSAPKLNLTLVPESPCSGKLAVMGAPSTVSVA